MKNKTIVVATNNIHKLNEINAILSNLSLYKAVSLEEAGINAIDVVENGFTYKENAYLKAKAYSNNTDFFLISDDSGLEIDILGNNKPGIHTSRFATDNGGQETTNKMLSKMARELDTEMRATFFCTICLITPDKSVHYFEGEMEGSISPYVSDGNGFGYDPIFVEKNTKKIISTMTDQEKNTISHRYNALVKLVKFLDKTH